MKINREKLSEITKQGDEELWATIRGIAGRYGIKLPDKTPSENEMSRLRGALSGTERVSLSDAMEILNTYRRRNK